VVGGQPHIVGKDITRLLRDWPAMLIFHAPRQVFGHG
jgi:hypothetical protein